MAREQAVEWHVCLCSSGTGKKQQHGKHTLKASPMPSHTGRAKRVCVQAKILHSSSPRQRLDE